MTKDDSTIQKRTCRYCNGEQPLENFPLIRGKRFYRCQQCISTRSVEWQRLNREKSNACKRAWMLAHAEKDKASKTSYARREDVKIRAKIRKEERRDEINARYRQQFREDPTPFNIRNRRRKERERAVEGVFTVADERAMLSAQNGKCNRCAIDISNGNYHADHVIALVNGGSHWPANRQLLCPKCNHLKGTK